MQLLFLQARRIAWELQPLGLELFASHGTCQNGGQKVRQTLCVEVDNAGHLSIIVQPGDFLQAPVTKPQRLYHVYS